LTEPVRVTSTLTLDIRQTWRDISDRLVEMAAAQLVVVSDPKIRGGEPVVNGTRIPAYLLHELAEQGATAEELLADYPALDRRRLDRALLYVKTHPRPGRPRKQAWCRPGQSS
jgi:uncharacterized protein (DUF433 family)